MKSSRSPDSFALESASDQPGSSDIGQSHQSDRIAVIQGILLAALLSLNLAGLLLPAPELPKPPGMEETSAGEALIRYVDQGAGDIPVILLHGSPGSSGDFDDFLRRAAVRTEAGEGFAPSIRFFAPDMPGFGASPSGEGSLGLHAQAEHLLAYIDSMGIERAHFLGYSWGGGLAIILAARHPERVRSITLTGSWGIVEGEPSGNYWLEKLRYAAAVPYLAVLPGALGTLFSSPDFPLDHEHRMGFLRSFSETDLRPMRKLMQGIGVPAFVLHGERDGVVEPWVAEEHARLIDGARLEFFDGGHGSIFGRSDAFLPQFLKFVEEVDSSAGAEAGHR